MSLFSKFYGTLLKSLCYVNRYLNQSLVLRNLIEQLLSNSRGPSQKQPVKEISNRWYENKQNIPGKN